MGFMKYKNNLLTHKTYILITFVFLLSSLVSQASTETHINIFHTSDIHGHFTNSDSPLRLGGVARLKYKLDQLRQKNQNSLTLDSGDWSEGTIFYTLNSGELNHRMMEFMGYDAIVLGNHEWLVGAQELYQGFEAAQFKIPVLSANLQLDKLPSSIPLQNYIKPYFVKEINGVKVGVLGLSTFELIFDSFFEPAEVTDPIRLASKYVKILREQEGCQVVILLTHTGIKEDKNLAQSVPGIDLIVGGHTHTMTLRPVYVNGVPIVHVGYWAQYLGAYDLVYKNGKTELAHHTIYQIDETIPEDPAAKTMVEGFQQRVVEKFGNIFNDNIVKSDVFLPLGDSLTENVLANWAVDAIRKAGQTSIALDVGQYYRRDLFSGLSSTVDFFNLFPHVYSSVKDQSWTIYNFEIRGGTIKQLVNVFAKLKLGVKISGGSYKVDGSELVAGIKEFRLGDKSLEESMFYKVSATKGLLSAIDTLKMFGSDIGIRNIKDTGIEAWRAIKDAVQAMSPITPVKTKWEGRIRTIQPDFHIATEQIYFTRRDDKMLMYFQVLNSGMRKLKIPDFYVRVDYSPKNTLDDKWLKITFPQYIGKTLQPGKTLSISTEIDVKGWPRGVYPIDIESLPVHDEIVLDNNSARSYFSL